VQTAQRNSLRLLQWMMVASLALPLALFIFASAVSWVSIRETADREIERALDVAHEHALKVFETIDRSLSEIAEIVRDVPDADIVTREQLLHLRLKQLVASLPQVKSAWVFDARGHALVNSLVVPAPEVDFSDRDYFKVHMASDIGTYIGEALKPRPSASAGGARARTAASPACCRRPYSRNISRITTPESAVSQAATSRSAARTAPCWHVSPPSIATSASTPRVRSGK
jgi:hypothetical protein